ncbi:MAG: Sensor protein ZraS [Verrucomicrobia subdivision 3 bacterium]|nr:Sensor protein ZraS [Limisphaerales bacterium]MCS1413471.1 Sensor protein ZraS [Limisphaerales bacterium]
MTKLFERLDAFFRRRWPQLEPADDPHLRQFFFRLLHVERNFGLPVKASVILLLIYYLFLTDWADNAIQERGVALATVQVFFVIYVLVNLSGGIMLTGLRQLPLTFTQLVVLVIAVVDVLLVAAMVLVTGGFDSPLYWIFVLLVVRNSISIPAASTQIAANLLVLICYLFAGLVDLAIQEIEQSVSGSSIEPFFLRIVVLGLMSSCCYGVQALFDRQRKAEEEAREHAIRQEQLQATGRLAAEIAHQLKNPLGIINNAAFNLQRTKREGKTITQQIEIIREEIDRSDRIITDLMGFAQLTEGKIEPMSIPEHLDRAVQQVFPKAADFKVTVHREYQPALPQIFMQRRHLSEIFVNILQNAREAMEGVGNIKLGAYYGDDYSVIVVIEDDGPGMSEEQMNQLFEPYYTTKEKGTGLGLAIVKHNVEIYGGEISVESEFVKGTKFCLQFPARTLVKLRR